MPIGAFRDKPLLSGFRSPHVMENLLAMGKDGVGNDLLEGGVLLRAGTRQEEIVLRLRKAERYLAVSGCRPWNAPRRSRSSRRMTKTFSSAFGTADAMLSRTHLSAKF
jgi:hypothetical protein